MATRDIALSAAQHTADRNNETQYVWNCKGDEWCFDAVPTGGYDSIKVRPSVTRPIDREQAKRRGVVY